MVAVRGQNSVSASLRWFLVWLRLLTGVDVASNRPGGACTFAGPKGVALIAWSVLLFVVNVAQSTYRVSVDLVRLIDGNGTFGDGTVMTKSNKLSMAITSVTYNTTPVAIHLAFLVVTMATDRWKHLWTTLQSAAGACDQRIFLRLRRLTIIGLLFIWIVRLHLHNR